MVLSRFAAKAGSVPRSIFDVLASHCGPTGKFLFETYRDSMLVLWRRSCAPSGSSERGGLPSRCNREWYLNTFCNGHSIAGDEDVWNSIVSFNAYSPMALLFSLPGVVDRYAQATPIQVRAATHLVIGWSADEVCVPNPTDLQKVLVHGLVYGARCNVSEFSHDPAEPITCGDDKHSFRFDLSEEALDEILLTS